jgi:hypothetical protein
MKKKKHRNEQEFLKEIMSKQFKYLCNIHDKNELSMDQPAFIATCLLNMLALFIERDLDLKEVSRPHAMRKKMIELAAFIHSRIEYPDDFPEKIIELEKKRPDCSWENGMERI